MWSWWGGNGFPATQSPTTFGVCLSDERIEGSLNCTAYHNMRTTSITSSINSLTSRDAQHLTAMQVGGFHRMWKAFLWKEFVVIWCIHICIFDLVRCSLTLSSACYTIDPGLDGGTRYAAVTKLILHRLARRYVSQVPESRKDLSCHKPFVVQRSPSTDPAISCDHYSPSAGLLYDILVGGFSLQPCCEATTVLAMASRKSAQNLPHP